MRAVVITRPGGPEVLELQDVPAPAPAREEVLVRVAATAVNRADLLQRMGRYPAPADAPQDIPGLEFAGEVAAVGPGVTRWRAGDRVFGITGGGAYAEYLVAHERVLARVPANLGLVEAAAVPEAFITAHDALITQAGLARGEAVLIHAVGSGVGLAGVQIARWRGAEAYGTTRTAAKLDAARQHGLTDGVVVGSDLSPIAAAAARWRPQGLDVVLDLVGGAYVPAGLDALGLYGRLILVGLVAGSTAEVRLDRILRKRLTVRGTVLRSRTTAEKADATAAFVRDVIPALEAGAMHPVIDRQMPLEEAASAHAAVAADRNTGKIVLVVS